MPASVVTESYDLKIRLLTDEFPFEGRAFLILKNMSDDTLTTLTLYLHPELNIESIKNSQRDELKFTTEFVLYDFNYTRTATAVNVALSQGLKSGESHTFEVDYMGWMNPSCVRSRSDGYFHVNLESVFLRSYAYSLWFPVVHTGWEGLNATARFHLELDIPDTWRPLAFGTLLSEVVEKGRNYSIWEISRPIKIIFPSIWAEPWKVSGTEKFRVYHHGSPESQKAAEIYTEIGTSLRQYFHDHYGVDLPPETFFLAEVRVPSGGYVSLNVVGLSTNGFIEVLNPTRYYAVLEWLGHEMVHEYVLPAVVPDAPGATILLESFPLYFHLPALVEILGRSFERWVWEREWKEYDKGLQAQAAKERRDIPPEKPLAAITLDELPTYKDNFLVSDKALIVLHHLEKEVGRDVFSRAVLNFLRAYRTTPATLRDFEVTLSQEAGRSLRAFFHRWFGTTEVLPMEWQEQDLSSK
jgi:hypothetical protein